MISGFDHAPMIVRDLDAAVVRATAMLGREPNWRGRLAGARHAWFQLSNFALDLIAPDGEGPAGDEARARLEKHGEGPSAIGFATPALDEACRMLNRRGVTTSPPAETRSTDEAGRERVWRIAITRASTTRGLQLFLVERDETAKPWPISPAHADEGAAIAAVDHVVVRTANAEASIALYGAKLDLDLRLDRSNPDWGSRLLVLPLRRRGGRGRREPERAGHRRAGSVGRLRLARAGAGSSACADGRGRPRRLRAAQGPKGRHQRLHCPRRDRRPEPDHQRCRRG